METLAFSHLAINTEDSDNQEYTVCVDFKKLSTVGAMGLLSAATVVGAMGVTADSASAHSYGYNSYGNYRTNNKYSSNQTYYYKKVVSYKEEVIRKSSKKAKYYGGYRGSYGGYGGYDCY